MIHKFKSKDINVVLDVNSGGVHVVDDITYGLLDYIEPPFEKECPGEIIAKLNGKYNKEARELGIGGEVLAYVW